MASEKDPEIRDPLHVRLTERSEYVNCQNFHNMRATEFHGQVLPVAELVFHFEESQELPSVQVVAHAEVPRSSQRPFPASIRGVCWGVVV